MIQWMILIQLNPASRSALSNLLQTPRSYRGILPNFATARPTWAKWTCPNSSRWRMILLGVYSRCGSLDRYINVFLIWKICYCEYLLSIFIVNNYWIPSLLITGQFCVYLRFRNIPCTGHFNREHDEQWSTIGFWSTVFSYKPILVNKLYRFITYHKFSYKLMYIGFMQNHKYGYL